MRNYTVFKGVNTKSLGIIQEQSPPVIIPMVRGGKQTVPGRDGYLWISDNADSPVYENTVVSVEYIIRDLSRINEIVTLFSGAGWVTFSNDPYRRYKARILNGYEITRWIRKYHRFVVQYELQPYKYEVNPQAILLSAESNKIYNPSPLNSLPFITIKNLSTSGDMKINGRSTYLTHNGGYDQYIDSEIMECYTDTVSRNNYISSFPRFDAGENTVIIPAGWINKITVRPNWRWI